MNKSAFALSLALTFSALSGAALAAEPETAPVVDADDCVWNYFNETAAKLDLPGAEFTLHYEDGGLEELVEHCETETGAKSTFFKGMDAFSYTAGNVTFDFK